MPLYIMVLFNTSEQNTSYTTLVESMGLKYYKVIERDNIFNPFNNLLIELSRQIKIRLMHRKTAL